MHNLNSWPSFSNPAPSIALVKDNSTLPVLRPNTLKSFLPLSFFWCLNLTLTAPLQILFRTWPPTSLPTLVQATIISDCTNTKVPLDLPASPRLSGPTWSGLLVTSILFLTHPAPASLASFQALDVPSIVLPQSLSHLCSLHLEYSSLCIHVAFSITFFRSVFICQFRHWDLLGPPYIKWLFPHLGTPSPRPHFSFFITVNSFLMLSIIYIFIVFPSRPSLLKC